MMRAVQDTKTTLLRDDVYARLEAESHELVNQRDIALAADPRSEMYRQYVVRMQAHIAALADYLNLSRRE